MYGTDEGYDGWEGYLALFMIFAVGTALRAVMLFHQTVISPDSPGYIYNALAIGKEGLKSLFAGGFAGNFSIYPIFIYLTNLVIGDPVLSGQLVSLVFGSLAILLVYPITKEIMGARAGLIVAFLVAVHPHLIRYSGMVLKDSTLIFFALGAVALGLFGCTRRNRLLIVLAGILAWTTAVVRLYGIIVVPSLALAIVVYTLFQREGIKETLLRLALFLFPLPVVGYIAFLIFIGPHNEFFIESFLKVLTIVVSFVHQTGTYRDLLLRGNPEISRGYLDVITRYPRVSAAVHFVAVFGTAFFFFFFVLFLLGIYIDRKNLLNKGPRLFILSFASVYIFFDLAILMVFFFLTKRQLMPLVIVLLPWSALTFERGITWLTDYSRARAEEERGRSFGRQFRSSPLSGSSAPSLTQVLRPRKVRCSGTKGRRASISRRRQAAIP